MDYLYFVTRSLQVHYATLLELLHCASSTRISRHLGPTVVLVPFSSLDGHKIGQPVRALRGKRGNKNSIKLLVPHRYPGVALAWLAEKDTGTNALS